MEKWIGENWSRERPLYLSLGEVIKDALENLERDAYSVALPSIRKLAGLLQINKSTVVAAYDYLIHKNLIYTLPGSGIFPVKPGEEKIVTARSFLQPHLPENLLPYDTVATIFEEIIMTYGETAFQRLRGEGSHHLPQAISQYMKQFNIEIAPGQVFVFSKHPPAYWEIIEEILNLGPQTDVFIENPTNPAVFSKLQSMGVEIFPIPTDSSGMDIEFLEKKISSRPPGGVKVLCMSSYLQEPNGGVYQAEKQEAIYRLSEGYDLYIVDLDFQSDLFLNQAPCLIKSLDIHDRVIHYKSFASLFPYELQYSCLLLPKHLSSLDIMAGWEHNQLLELFQARFFETSFYSYMGRLQSFYLEQMNYIHQHFPWVAGDGASLGGQYISLPIVSDTPSSIIAQSLLEAGILLKPGNYYSYNPRKDFPFLYMGLPDFSLEGNQQALKQIEEIIGNRY